MVAIVTLEAALRLSAFFGAGVGFRGILEMGVGTIAALGVGIAVGLVTMAGLVTVANLEADLVEAEVLGVQEEGASEERLSQN